LLFMPPGLGYSPTADLVDRQSSSQRSPETPMVEEFGFLACCRKNTCQGDLGVCRTRLGRTHGFGLVLGYLGKSSREWGFALARKQE
jgi:hypothetical protein